MEILHIMEIIFFFILGLIVYTYLGYPFLLFLRKENDYIKDGNFLPKVSLIITAHNEEWIIKSKLENSLVLDYPLEKLQIIIASDGSTDGTVRLAEEHHEVEVLDLSRMGKTAAQNEAVKRASGDIVVFSDTNAYYEPNAIRELVKWFVDSSIGCVCGELRYRGKSQELLYWKYEVILKELESRNGRLLGANGSIYAIRKELYVQLDEDAISDFIEPILIYGEGKDVIYESEAIAIEDEPKQTFNRKQRIILRSLVSLKNISHLISPFHKRNIFLSLISHKILHWFMPVLLLVLLVINFLLLRFSLFYQVFFTFQLLFYFSGLFIKPVRYFIEVNSAALLAIIYWIRGKKIITWSVNR